MEPPKGRRARYLVAFASSALISTGCGAGQTTERVFHGRSVVGPYIEPGAYAAFAEGTYLEQRGEWNAAELAYRRALDLDSKSPSTWTRLAALACRKDLKRALAAFHTEGIARDYAPAWEERARCLHQHGETKSALAAAERAVMLEPGNAGANLLIADIYRAESKPAEASAWLFAWVLSSPEAASHWKALYERATRIRDKPLARLARQELARRSRVGAEDITSIHSTSDTRGEGASGSEHADATISERGDIDARSSSSDEVGSSLSSALDATARGQPALALSRADLLLKANPDDADALVAALFASLMLGDEERLAEVLRRAQATRAPSPALAKAMTDLLRFRVGERAAEQWLAAYRRATASGAP